MTTLLAFKERLKIFYSKFERYITPAIKFVSTFLMLMVIKENIGFMERLASVPVMIILAVLAAFIPWGLNVVLVSLIILLHVYTLSMELAVVLLAVLLIMFLLYFRFAPKDSIVIILMPVLFFMKIPYLLPLVMGLIGTPLSIISVACGTLIYFILNYIGENAAVINNAGSGAALTNISNLIDGMVKDEYLILTLLAFSLVVIVVYAIKRLSVDYSWSIAIVVGGILNIFIMLIGDWKLEISEKNPMIVGCLISMVLVYILQYFILSVDYSRTEYTQFEDDEYYYYVKAVPKMKVVAPEVKVKRINTQKPKRAKKK